MRRLGLSFILFLLTVQITTAGNLGLINRWYEALRITDRPTFQQLLASSAIIDLKQLGIVQDKNEFIESLDNWEDVSGDVRITISTVSSTSRKIVVDVCYRLPSDAFTNRETFLLKGGQVTKQTQEKLRDGC